MDITYNPTNGTVILNGTQASESGPIWAAGYLAIKQPVEGITAVNQVQSAVQAQGWKALSHFAGSFSWLVWDATTSSLRGAVDRQRLHPLYYARQGAKWFLAERVETLLANPDLSHEINPRAVFTHLMGLPPPDGETFFKTIHAIPSAHWFELDSAGLRDGVYWELNDLPVLHLKNDTEYASEQREILLDVIPQHLPVATNQIGITLSSGLDSACVAAILRHTCPNLDLHSLSWSSPDLPSADETAFISDSAAWLGLPVHWLRADQYWPLSTGLCTRSSTPFANFYRELWSATFALAVEHNLHNILTGAPGDLLWGGNVFAYPDLFLQGRWGEMIAQIRHHIPRSPTGITLPRLLRQMILEPILNTYLPWRSASKKAPPWLGPTLRPLVTSMLPSRSPVAKHLPARQRRLDLLSSSYHQAQLEDVGELAARAGIELRHPLTDHRLIEFAAKLPSEQITYGGQQKVILRRALANWLHPSILKMYDKIYLTALADRGLREREQSKIWPLLKNMRAADLGWVNEANLRMAFQTYLDGHSNSARFWYAIGLEDWLRRYF